MLCVLNSGQIDQTPHRSCKRFCGLVAWRDDLHQFARSLEKVEKLLLDTETLQRESAPDFCGPLDQDGSGDPYTFSLPGFVSRFHMLCQRCDAHFRRAGLDAHGTMRLVCGYVDCFQYIHSIYIYVYNLEFQHRRSLECRQMPWSSSLPRSPLPWLCCMVAQRNHRRVELRRLLWTFAHSLGSTELLPINGDTPLADLAGWMLDGLRENPWKSICQWMMEGYLHFGKPWKPPYQSRIQQALLRRTGLFVRFRSSFFVAFSSDRTSKLTWPKHA